MVRYAIFGRRRSMTALSPMVLAWLNTVEPATPSRRAPSMTGAGGSDRLLGTLVTEITPSRTATTSVNVPPTSTPNIVLSLRLYGVSTSREGSDADHRTERAKSRRSGAVDGVQAVDTFHGIPPTPLGEDAIPSHRGGRTTGGTGLVNRLPIGVQPILGRPWEVVHLDVPLIGEADRRRGRIPSSFGYAVRVSRLVDGS
ncbi:Uncharacterised protein [Mycobacteroides abscessus subsp. abscessus]|nr:Uncharacterised protein [Mycobacteroides abscessus subsp. abscessus]